MDRCVVLVDAGYLLGAAATVLAEDRSRSSLTVDYPALVGAIIAEAEHRTGLPVLRVLWYDGAPDALPTPEHRSLSVLPDVKVRLGMLVWHNGKVEQKGVDSFLQRDLTALARNHAVADVVLVGGDEDLRRGLDEAQDHGVKVHLWGVEAAEPQYNQSRSLIAEADRRWVISADWIKQYVTCTRAQSTPEAATPTPADSAAKPATTAVPADGAPHITATPADIARLTSHFNHGASAQVTVNRHDSTFIPRLRDLSEPRQQWQDTEDDNAAGALTARDIGARYGHRWASRATAAQRAALLADHPILPRQLDGEVLKYANDMGIDTWEDEPAKHAVRGAVWEAIEAADACQSP